MLALATIKPIFVSRWCRPAMAAGTPVIPQTASPPPCATAQPPPPPPSRPPFNISLGTDALLAMSALGWLIWDRFLRERLTSRLDGVFAPIEDERRLNSLVAQVGVITGANRVILCAFHNGAIDSCGYHLIKVSTINSYVAQDAFPMADTIRDLPVGRIMNEIERMMQLQRRGGRQWDVVTDSPALAQPCRDHLTRSKIDVMFNRLVSVGNLPIGILSLQYHPAEASRPPLGDEPHAKILEDLYQEIASIMRRRIVSPGPIRRLTIFLQGGLVKKVGP
jgi:hypothetical protein